MLFLKNLLLRNFQGCCLLFNYQGSSLFLLIRSSFDILSRRFLFVKNFFHFLFSVCSGSVSSSQVSFNRLSHPHPSVKNFFYVVQRSALASCPTVALGLILFIGLSQRQVVSYHGKSEKKFLTKRSRCDNLLKLTCEGETLPEQTVKRKWKKFLTKRK